MSKIKPKVFLEFLKGNGITFFAGVPDSLLKNFTNCLFDNINPENNIIAPNEGSAVGLGIGHFFSQKTPPLIYMQNSGIGNAINPIISLADPKVLSIPMILLIGWRGELLETGEQIKDEPQHVKQGEITLNLLKTLEIPYLIISKNIDYAKIQNLIFQSINSNKPVALVVKKDVFQEYNFSQNEIYNSLTREDAIKQILKFIPKNSIIVSTTGMTSRELYEIRDLRKENHDQDFLTIGGMGHASSIAIGIAKSKPNSEILCIDGDGSIIMHMGILPT